ncbi:hypothetical protein [Novosphingobium sp. P6W]|uniref:hypothetical protein n=1 Tax=Novosphingobium sp. P6W TaxID=1609758 RepID=UPI0005C2CDC9|nr:hypothetical protein [Novosphingobium sp. P6W]AXB76435.1 hypothetical protein TQ38_007880 [Novosphingobium sp. P6W]KIS32065.1 hypothetical protein TQ38_12905 [Novosphingobium sp. P6W]
MAFIKALIPGALLTWIVSGVLGSNGSRGGMLAIEHVSLQGYGFHWSWSLFLAATGLAWAIFAMLDS